jgi:2-dehydro-3-deoxyphosphooctonate aldolase (KDO 8-P synthase)
VSASFEIAGVAVGGGDPLILIGGPCVAETEGLCCETAEFLKGLCERLGIGYIFKASFDKANRMSVDSPRGPGLEEGLRILSRVASRVGVPLLTDVHETAQAQRAGEVVDVIQVPAFLCRQTDLLVAAGRTGKAVNIKKGQFLSPWDIEHSARKVASTGNSRILLTERGTSFGYGRLIVDMKSFPTMRRLGYPVVYDLTHSLQLPGGKGASSGGEREYARQLARAAAGAGIDALFVEVHPDPERALSDAATSLDFADAESILTEAVEIDRVVKSKASEFAK